MRHALAGGVALLLMTAATVALAEKTDARTLTGSYVWNQRGNSGDLEGVFTPTGENRWDVAFHFEFRGKPHVYRGTAAGSLSSGALQGTVFNEGKRRQFTFSGQFEDGTFRGTHAEVGDSGDSYETGTLTLR